MALGSTRPLREMSTRSISWGKGGQCIRLTTLPPSCAVVMKSGNLNFLEPSGPLQACNGTALPICLIFLDQKSFHQLFLNCEHFCVFSDPSFSFIISKLIWLVLSSIEPASLLRKGQTYGLDRDREL